MNNLLSLLLCVVVSVCSHNSGFVNIFECQCWDYVQDQRFAPFTKNYDKTNAPTMQPTTTPRPVPMLFPPGLRFPP